MLRSRVAAGAAKPGPRAGCRDWSFSRSPQDNTSHQPEGCREGRGLSRGGPPTGHLGIPPGSQPGRGRGTAQTWLSHWFGAVILEEESVSSPAKWDPTTSCPANLKDLGRDPTLNFFLIILDFQAYTKLKNNYSASMSTHGQPMTILTLSPLTSGLF